MTGNVGIGILGVCMASVFWGSCFTVCKGYDMPSDGVHFAFLMSIGILLCGLITLVLWSPIDHDTGDYQVLLSQDGVLGGFLWAVGNFLTVPIIECVGLAIGMAIWAGVNMIVAFTVGAMGLPHGLLPKEPLTHPSCGVMGVLCALGGLCIFANIKAETSTSDVTAQDGEANNEEEAAPTIEDEEEQPTTLTEPLLPEEGNNTTTNNSSSSSSISGNLPLGVALACTAGVFYGFQMVPLSIWNDKVHRKGHIFANDTEPLPSDTVLALRFFFSQFAGIFVTALAGFVVYLLVVPHPQLVPAKATVASIACGIVWAIGCAGAMIATCELGNSVGFCLVLNCTFLINSAWGVFVFKEIQGRRNLQLFGGAFFLNFLSSLLISISKA